MSTDVVPFVALRAGERPEIDCRERDQADSHGFYWAYNRAKPDGCPDYGRVHVQRTRECMEFELCQVCGKSARRGARCSWLVAAEDFDDCTDIFTMHAPVCIDCLPLSLRECPHIRATRWYALWARRSRVVAAYGTLTHADGRMESGVALGIGDRRAQRFLAKQWIVQLFHWEIMGGADTSTGRETA